VALIQYIYTSVLDVQTTPKQAETACLLSAALCRKFGITGRVFTNCQQALAIIEGPDEVATRYFKAVTNDPMSASAILHVKRSIPAREFPEFIVLLNSGEPFKGDDYVQLLTPESLQNAWPENLSAKVRILAEAYLDPDMLKP